MDSRVAEPDGQNRTDNPCDFTRFLDSNRENNQQRRSLDYDTHALVRVRRTRASQRKQMKLCRWVGENIPYVLPSL